MHIRNLLAVILLAAITAAPTAGKSVVTCQGQKPPSDARVIAAALDKLRPLLTDKQRAALDRPLNAATAIHWSNLPIGVVPREGLRLGDLDEKQRAAAAEIFDVALSRCGNHLLTAVRAADDYLIAFDKRPIGWNGGNYYLSVLGDSSAKKPWMLQIGGHHLAYNFTFNGREAGATPMFLGSEPIRFEVQGITTEPLSMLSNAMSRVAMAIAPLPTARLSGTFTDVVKGVIVTGEPGQQMTGGTDTGFPHTYPSGDVDRGVKVSTLSPEQQELVRIAIAIYASLPDDGIASTLRAQYLSPADLNETFVGFAGSPDLGTQGSYVRIDGPRVWIELVVQRAIALPDQLHYHSLWRDKQSDYGGEFRH